jgi:hypothetical protein
MSGINRVGSAVLLLVLAAASGSEAADGYCAQGAVNAITGNYTGTGSAGDGEQGFATTRCEICLVVRVPGEGGWEEAGRVCNIWSETVAHDVMFRIGQCGLIMPVFEQAGTFYGANAPIRVDAVRQSPCQ